MFFLRSVFDEENSYTFSTGNKTVVQWEGIETIQQSRIECLKF